MPSSGIESTGVFMNFRNFKIKLPKGSEQDKISRVVYITAVSLLLGIVILAAFTTAANRARKPAVTTPSVGDTSNSPESSAPDTGSKPDDTGVGEVVPTFALPVDGTLGMKHDPDNQRRLARSHGHRYPLRRGCGCLRICGRYRFSGF